MGKVNRGKTKLAEICFLPKNVCTYLLYGLRIDLRGSLCTWNVAKVWILKDRGFGTF